MSPWLILAALREFVLFDVRRRRAGFSALHTLIDGYETRPVQSRTVSVWKLREAVKIASLLYFKKVHCFQRSVALARLLRRHGYQAKLIIGYQQVPLRSHAWVEFEGQCITDKVKGQKFFQTLATW